MIVLLLVKKYGDSFSHFDTVDQLTCVSEMS